LHVGRGAQAVSILVALVPDDLVGQRLGGNEKNFLFLGKAGDRQTDMRGEGADQERHLLASHQFLGQAHGVARVAVVVAADDLQLAAENATGAVDFVEREFHPMAIRLEECRKLLVLVDLAELDRLREQARREVATREKDGEQQEKHAPHRSSRRLPPAGGARAA
jgi:hypothetical protein